jgi:DNA-binding response OmpR family regulator
MQTEEQRDEPAGRRRQSGQRVLVVDDHPDTAELLGIVLKLDGHEIKTAHDGDAALRAARAFKPHVAILDLGLPLLSGLQLAQLLRRELPHIRLFAATGRAEPEVAARCRDSGFEHTLVKPIDTDHLRALLRRKATGGA